MAGSHLRSAKWARSCHPTMAQPGSALCWEPWMGQALSEFAQMQCEMPQDHRPAVLPKQFS
jgi:hypothetical protein